ncbi:hypothetical protein CNR27_01430 [Luteimonas chenhongjianii]|uniref:Uncharacterized protein n=2 Tax=Luteimonas chenhongjianii TaxID=2006110 RepID=A0A290XBG1_9GAMM|nr:hypothetical protein CNR27_01430 [Luteimonas chenhongjianii]
MRYGNRHGGSGVRAWRLEGNLLSVEFVDGAVYDYQRQEVGSRRFDAACAAARAGRGLSSCISRHLRDRYADRYDDRRAWDVVRNRGRSDDGAIPKAGAARPSGPVPQRRRPALQRPASR